MSKKIFSLIFSFFLILFILVSCDNKGKIAIQVETEMKVGETYQIKYELENIDKSVELSWKVSDTGMAELDSSKLTIKPLKEGIFTLTVAAKTGEVSSKEIRVEKGEGPIRYTISFELNGGQVEDFPIEYDGSKDIILPNPTKEGYNFKGWYEKNDFVGNAVEKIVKGETGNRTFYAKWEEEVVIKKYTIILELNGGQVEDFPIDYDGTVDVFLPTPTFAGYEFQGWYENAEFTGAAVEKIISESTGDKKFYAKWEVVEYKIVLELDGGQAESIPTNYTVESQPIKLPIPTKEGYEFKGWYEKSNFSGVAIEEIKAGSTGNKIYYAKWTVKVDPNKPNLPDGVYSITYELNGGFLLNAPSTYDGSKTVYLYTPLKHGYYFVGWYKEPDFSGSSIEIIEKGTAGDIILYAKWVLIK